MKKRALFALIALLLSSSLFGAYEKTWQTGVEAGYTLSFYNRSGWENGTDYPPGHYFTIGIPVEYRFNDWLSVTTGLSYSGKSYISRRTLEDEQTTQTTLDLTSTEHFFEIPLTVRFSLGNDFVRGYLGAGIYAGIRFYESENGSLTLSVFDTVGSSGRGMDMNADNIFHAGLLTELGAGFSFTESGELFISARYQYSFTELDRKYQENRIKRYIDTLSFTLGYTFRMGGDV